MKRLEDICKHAEMNNIFMPNKDIDNIEDITKMFADIKTDL